jgi:hydroxymethylpyrimidine/phosphomethylpyrimidine kinase
MRAPKYILSLAALDTSGGAGLNQDTRVAYLHGCHLLTCCTALTLQTSHGVEAIYPTSAQQLQTMLLRMLSQYDVSAVKIGALVNAEQIDLVHNTFSHARSYPVVLDPVLAPTEGAVFIAPNLREMYRRMLHSIDYVIPNLPELSILSDLHVEGRDSILNAAKTITETYSTNVFVSGGHGRDNKITEWYICPQDVSSWTKERHDWHYTHGTGCALSTAFTCLLASGMDAPTAAKQSSRWVSEYYQKWNTADD